MKITKFRVLSMISILGCAAAWSGLARSRSGEAASSNQVTAAAPGTSFVQHASAVMPTDEGIQLLPSDSSGAQRSSTVQSFDAPSHKPKSEVVESRGSTRRNDTGLGRSVRDLSAPPISTVGHGKPSSTGPENATASISPQSVGSSEETLANDNPNNSTSYSNALSSHPPTNIAVPRIPTPSSATPATGSPTNGSQPVKKRQVVDLRGRIASNATEVRGTAVSGSQQQGTTQQRSPEWVDSAIPKELFDRAQMTPRGNSRPSDPARATQENAQPANTVPGQVAPTIEPSDSSGIPDSRVTPDGTPGSAVPNTALPSIAVPNTAVPDIATSDIATPNSFPGALPSNSVPGNSVRAQNDSALGLPSPNTPSLPEVVDRSGQPIHSDSGSSGRVPGSSFSADQAISQSLKPEGGKANAADAQAKPNAQFPRTILPAERSNHSASDSTDSPRELAPPPSANSGDTAPATDAVAPTAPRQYPTRRQMIPDQVIPNWVYDQAGIKPPQEPIPGPGNANPNANVPLGPRNQAVPAQQPGLSNQPPAATQPKVAPPIQPNQPVYSTPAPSGGANVPSQNGPSQRDPRSIIDPTLQMPDGPNSVPVPQTVRPGLPAQVNDPNSIAPRPQINDSEKPGADSSSAQANAAVKKSYDPVFCMPEDYPTAMDPGLCRVGCSPTDFSCQGGPQGNTFDACAAAHVYRGKFAITTQRPLVELWRPLYTGGIYAPAKTWFGVTNPMKPHFMVYGDARTVLGFNHNAQGKSNVWGNVLNLDMDLQLTSTERIHAFVSPLNRATRASGLSFNDGVDLLDGTNFNFNTLFFEGDAGALIGGADGRYPPFDLPFTFGLIPLVYQNGIWANDAVLGAAMALPAKNSSLLKWSNFDASIFWATDNITTDAFPGRDHAADFVGTAWFIDAYEGYIEADYAFVNDNTGNNLGYHNVSLAFTRRYLARLSNSVRIIVNAGQQDLAKANRTADGSLLLIENSLITAYPNTIVPYFNMFYGQGRPQSLARAGIAGGILTNTGINFETDGITGYPTLDPTGRNTMGFASGVNLLGSQFSHQLVLEFALLKALGSQQFRNAAGNEYGFGVRYQKPLSNNMIFRTDQMVGLRDDATNVTGSRVELRWKF